MLETGRVVLADDARALREDRRVRAAYLGEDLRAPDPGPART